MANLPVWFPLVFARSVTFDSSDAVHHVMGRGIERKEIFPDNQDREDFITRLAPPDGSYPGWH